jgi:HK97 family phage major capsid protein
MTSGAFFYVAQESGSLDTAAETAELSLKPGGDLTLTSQMIAIQTVAHWLKIARQALDDVPGFGQTINQRLIYGVSRRIEQQILSGDGTANNILGILNQTGLQTVAFTAGAIFTDLILTGIEQIWAVESEPDAVVCNPADYGTMLAAKTTGSGERLDSVGAFVTPGDVLWGLPLIVSTVIPAGQVLVGAFGLESMLYVREGVNLRTSDADQDDFTRNRLTMLAEARVGFATWHANAFCLVHTA